MSRSSLFSNSGIRPPSRPRILLKQAPSHPGSPLGRTLSYVMKPDSSLGICTEQLRDCGVVWCKCTNDHPVVFVLPETDPIGS